MPGRQGRATEPNTNQKGTVRCPHKPASHPWRVDGEDYQPRKSTLLWACAATVVATLIVGFNWGGWVTGGTSRTPAATAGDVARGELASAVCVDRFKAAPDAATKLAELKALTDSYKERQFIETGGWATMPGKTSADRLGAESCAVALAA